jgi:SAM-dependent MidA family methyltransferase
VTLRQKIEQEIRERGPIPFSRYMELCLYHPESGYYSRPGEKFGKTGDFYTSSDVHAVFGRLMARQFDEMWRCLGAPGSIDLVELGPGRGLFAQDVRDWAKKKFPDFLGALRYRLVEASPSLRERLCSQFAEAISAGKVSVHGTLDELAALSMPNAILFANEFFDALPVEVLSSEGQLRIGVENNRFRETFYPPTPAELEYLDHYGIHPEPGERVEAPLLAQQYMKQAAGLVPRGFVIVIDYGYAREELLSGRHRGTVTAYRQHAVSGSPYEAPGEQDITAHVNFTALRAAGEAAGLEPLALLTQSQLLMGIGEQTQFSDAFEDLKLPQERTKVTLQLKHLVIGMGEVFHALLMSRGISKEKAARLGGLAFTRSRM